MNVKTCRRCKRLFNYVMGPITCNKCREEMEAKFQDVKKYIQDNPGSHMTEVSEVCEVPILQLQQWLREGRLMLSDESPIGIDCEVCGKMIKSGRYCPECQRQMVQSFQQAMGVQPTVSEVKKKDTKASARMRFLDQ